MDFGGQKYLDQRGESVWKSLIHDAKDRNCFFNATDDKDLAEEMFKTMKMQVPCSSPATSPDATSYNYNSKVSTSL